MIQRFYYIDLYKSSLREWKIAPSKYEIMNRYRTLEDMENNPWLHNIQNVIIISSYGVNRFWGKIDVAYYKENVTDPNNPNKTVVEAHNR